MFSYANNGITVASILDQRREMKEGTFPVKVRVTFKRQRKYYSTGNDLSTEEWGKLPETKSKKQISVRIDIQYSFEKVKNAVIQLERNDKFSFAALNNYLGKSTADNTIGTAFQAKIESLLNESRIGSYNYYKDALKTIEDFAGKNIPFEYVTVTWLKKFEKHLLSTGKNYTTVGMKCRAIRSIMNDALSLIIFSLSRKHNPN